MKKSLFSVIFALAALLFAGCSSGYQPGITGLGIELTRIERGADGLTRVHWLINNPNIIAYLVGGSTHKIYLDGGLVGTTTLREPIGVPKQSQQPQSAILKIEGTGGHALTIALSRGSATYRLESNLTITVYGEGKENYRAVATGTVLVVAK